MKEISGLCCVYGVTLRPLHITSEDNTVADMLSRVTDPKKEVTPEELFATLREWSARELSTTHWTPVAATHPELQSLVERHDFD